MKNNNLFSVENKITITVRENSYAVRVPFSFKHLLKDFSSKFLSYAYIYNKRQKRRVAVLDKSFFIKREFADHILYTFVKESLMDLTVYLKFRGIDILNKDEFEIVVADNFIPKDINIKLQDKYVLREDQNKYLNAIMDNNMQKALIEARPGFGKLQPLDSLIRIPNGWKRMGDMQLGDDVIARDGTSTKVIGVYPQGIKKIFKITFADGRSTEAGGEHLWKIYQEDIDPEIINTYEIKKRLLAGYRCYIDLVEHEKCKTKTEEYKYVVNSYNRGLMLAEEKENIEYKFILESSEKEKMDFLKGLFRKKENDNFNFGQKYYLETDNEDIVRDVQLLTRSLGAMAKYAYVKNKYVLEVRCLNKDKQNLSDSKQLYYHKLEIRSIELIGEKEAQCIAIEHPEHLYVTDDYIVTHNTVLSLGIACAKKKRIMLLLPGYVNKWKLDVLNVLDITEKDVYVIQGKDSIIKLINKIKNKEEINYKVYIVSEASLMPYADKDRESYGKGYMEISDIIRYLEIGTVLIDEIHEKFFQSFYLLLLINTQLLIGMTGTYTSGNSYVRKFQDILFPAKTRLNFIKIERFTNTYAIDYLLEFPKSAKYLQQNMYNHDTYENSTLIANRSKLLNFIDMLEYYLEDSYIRNYKEGNKMVIFVASVRFATMLAKYFSSKYRQFDIRRYTSDDPYENILEPDIIITTLQSAGTAIDIPRLKVVFNTVVSLSEVRNVQSHGRLRKLEGEEVLYYYFYSTSIPKHASFHKTRAEQLKPYSKEFRYIRYNKKI